MVHKRDIEAIACSNFFALKIIYNQLIHKRDVEAIASSNSFALKILAAADRFELNGLRRQCESYIAYGEVIT